MSRCIVVDVPAGRLDVARASCRSDWDAVLTDSDQAAPAVPVIGINEACSRLEAAALVHDVESLRPSWWIPQDGDDDVLTDGMVILEGRKPLRAGEEGLVRILPVVPEYWRSVQPGMELGMFDGPRIKYGIARIVEGLSTR